MGIFGETSIRTNLGDQGLAFCYYYYQEDQLSCWLLDINNVTV